jgi:hypothetical protein
MEPLELIGGLERKSLANHLMIMKVSQTAFALLAGSVLVLSSGCSSLVCGSKQSVMIDSRPNGAQVLVYNKACEVIYSNTTPCTATLQRQSGDCETGCYVVLVSKDGFAPVQVPLVGRVNSAYYLNVFTGIGFIIDPMTGGMWTLSPENVDGSVVRDAAGPFSQDGLFIALRDKPLAPAFGAPLFSELSQVSAK